MSYNKILIPTDGSELTRSAIDKGLEFAKLAGSEVTALYVLDQSIYSSMPMDAAVVNIYETLEKDGQNATRYIKEKGESMGIIVKEKIIEGVPPTVIIAESENYDLIVMGTLGRTGVRKALMGSVAEKVVQKGKCPVMVVSQKLKLSE